MRGAESIIYKNIGKTCQSLAQLGIVLGLALDVAGVLQEHHIAVLQGGSLGLGILACHVGSHDDLLAQQLCQAVSNHLQAQLGLPLALGLAHVGAENDLCTVVNEILDGGQRCNDTLIRGDLAVLRGNIEVTAAQHPLAGNVDVLDRLLVVVHGDFLHHFAGSLPIFF